MMSSLLYALGAISSTLAVAPFIAPRDGPSGQVITPAGGTVVGSVLQNPTLEFAYQPVTESTNPGYATQYIDLYIWNEYTGITTPLALGLSSPVEYEDVIVSRSGLITANFSFSSGGICGTNLQLVVREYQTGTEAPTYGF